MAAKMVPASTLLRPSEFSSQRKSRSKVKTLSPDRSGPAIKSDLNLMPPSKYVSGKTSRKGKDDLTKYSRPSVGSDPATSHALHPKVEDDTLKVRIKEKVNIDRFSEDVKTPLEFQVKQKPSLKSGTIKDSSVHLLMEIQSCKSQNEKLHQELISQLQKLASDKCKDATSADTKRINDALLHVHENHERSSRFHDLMEAQLQKQADTIDKVMQQFLDRQSELNSSNEKLSMKLLRVQEEHRDMQMHLEKQLDFKEKQCSDYKNSLQKTENELQELKMKYRSELGTLQGNLKLKDEMIASLEEASKTKDRDIQKLHDMKQKELDLLQENTSRKVRSLNEALSRYEKDYEMEKQEHEKALEIMLAKEKEVCNNMITREQELRELMATLEGKNNEIKLLNASIERRDEEIVKKTEKLKSEMQWKIDTLEENCIRIKSEYEHQLDDEKQKLKVYEEKFDHISKELERSRAEVKDFHAYIAEKEFEFNSNDLKSKVKMLGDENLQLRETCQSLESAVELLNVRLLSLNNIIKIQETELSKDGIHIVDERSPKILSKWRDKVYSLLVQLKSHEILENEDMRNLKSKLTITQKQSQEQLAKISLLENQLAEKSADLELRNSKLRTLSREVVGLEDQYRKQREKEDSLNHCYHQISSFTLIFKEKFGKEFDKLEEGIALFRSLEGRISFAYNRLSTIQDLFQRKITIWQSKVNNAVPDKCEDTEKGQELSTYDKQSLLAELQILTDEREMLRNKIKTDTDRMISFEKNLEAEYKGEIDLRTEEVARLQAEVNMKSKQNDELKMIVGRLEIDCTELKTEKESMQIDAARLESQYEKELAKKLDVEKECYKEELSKMERIISDTRREHTKAIVSLQQLERKMQWQKQNNGTLLKENEEVYKHELNQLKRNIRELEKERNILVTTIKQENIKIPRQRHVGFEVSPGKEQERTTSDASGTKQIQFSRSQDGGKHGNQKGLKHDNVKLSKMLKELQSLSASLLRDDRNSGEPEISINEDSTSEEL